MNELPLTLKEVLERRLVPISKDQLMKLVKYGERKKIDKLPEGINYIIAMNTGNGSIRARWSFDPGEIQAWYDRARQKATTPKK